MKVKTIKLSDGHAPANRLVGVSEAEWKMARRFRVEQITDSIEYYTGQMLERVFVEELCNSKDWKVTIVPFR